MIKGEKCGLRAVEKEDLALLRDWRNIEEFRINFREHRELSLSDQEIWHEMHILGNKNNFMFVIEDLKTAEAVGACGLLYTNWIARYADFSFYIGKDEAYIDNVYAPESARLLIDYGFNTLNLNKIWMELYEFDKKKLEFFKGLAFKVDGTLRQNCYAKGKYWDSHILSLLRDES